jgi:hypothetical protein
MNNILIICRNLNSIYKFSHIKPQPHNHYILASDDPRVYEAAKMFPWIDKVTWIEQMESFYNVSEDVIRFTEIINEWLKKLANNKYGFPEELLFFTKHVEGGMTTQRIQDLLLLIRSYQALIDEYKINKVIIICHSGMKWEDEVLIETARSKGVPTQIIRQSFIKFLINNIWSYLEVYARAIYYSVNVIRFKLTKRFKANKNFLENEIVFQLHSSRNDSVHAVVNFMKPLRTKGYNPIALCWHSNERYTKKTGAIQVQKEGLYAEQLEKWCSFRDIWKVILKTFWTMRKANEKKRFFIYNLPLNYKSLQLGRLLWPSIRYFLIAELPHSYLFFKAIKRYFRIHKPVAIKLWGIIQLREGMLAWKSLDHQNMPLIFDFYFGVGTEYPYLNTNLPLDLLFVPGKIYKEFVARTINIASDNIIMSGYSRYEGLTNFKKEYSKEKSLLCLGIPNRFSMYILFDFNAPLRGYLNQREQIIVFQALMEFACQYSFVALLIKPHPSFKEDDILRDVIKSYSKLKNVFLINKKMLPYHALNASDILITKYSTIGLEAMLFGCSVICYSFDGEKRFRIYEGAAEYIFSTEELKELLIKLLNEEFRQKWHKEQRQKQDKFLSDYFYELKQPPYIFQAAILDTQIKKLLHSKELKKV